MRYQNTHIAPHKYNYEFGHLNFTFAPDMSRICELKNNDQKEAIEFLAIRPVHTVVMTSGVESRLNRGRFFGYRNTRGVLCRTGIPRTRHRIELLCQT